MNFVEDDRNNNAMLKQLSVPQRYQLDHLCIKPFPSNMLMLEKTKKKEKQTRINNQQSGEACTRIIEQKDHHIKVED